jgi:hypothetical protein
MGLKFCKELDISTADLIKGIKKSMEEKKLVPLRV